MAEIRVAFTNAENIHVADLFWDANAPIVDFGIKGTAYEQTKIVQTVSVEYFGGIERPDVLMTFTVIDGYPICSEVRVVVTHGARSISMVDLPPGGQDFDYWRKLAFRAVQKNMTITDDGRATFALSDLTSKDIEHVPAGNKKVSSRMTTEKLATVAALYARNPHHALKAIAETYQVSERTASRYVDQARKAGLVEDRRRNKTN